MASRANLFCPFCNAKGCSQPILSPMTCVYILGQPQLADSAPKPGAAKPRHASHFEYRCSRCGYTEIHNQMFGEAA